MSLPKTFEEWEIASRAWRDKARKLLPAGESFGPRSRPRDPDEERALRLIGADRSRPFATLHGAVDAAGMIRRARKRAGLSQTQLARRMGIRQQQIQRLEDPDRSNPTVRTLEKLAQALGARLRIELGPAIEPADFRPGSAPTRP